MTDNTLDTDPGTPKRRRRRPPPTPLSDPLIRGWVGISAAVGKSISQMKRDVRDKKFPPPISVGANSVAWRESWVSNWLDEQPRRQYGADD